MPASTRSCAATTGALSTLADGSIVVIHSTVRPSTCIRLQADYPALRILDAPVSGGGHKAAARELLVMVGGDEATLDECRPILETFGNPVLHLGPLGAGQEAKLLNNTLFTAQLALAAEVFDVAAQRGLDQASVAQILATGSGRSFAADIVGGSGFNLDSMAAGAGTLLAKDVGILAAHTGLTDSPLLNAADAALERMGVPPDPRRGPPCLRTCTPSVMMTEAPDTRTPFDIADREFQPGGVWSRPGLSVRDRRIVTIVCVSAAVDVPAMDAHVYAALASGDLTVEQLNEFTLHFAVYCGWPRASQLEASVRSQWQRLHEERGEPVPAFPARTIDDLGVADPAERLAGRHGVLRGDQPHPVTPTRFAVLLRRHPELRVRPPLAAPRPVASRSAAHHHPERRRRRRLRSDLVARHLRAQVPAMCRRARCKN